MNKNESSAFHQFKYQIVDKLTFPPLKDRKGKEKPYNTVIPIFEVFSNNFPEPVIITSDLHLSTLEIMQIIDQRYNLENFHVYLMYIRK